MPRTYSLAEFMWMLLFRMSLALFIGRMLARTLAANFLTLYTALSRFDSLLR